MKKSTKKTATKKQVRASEHAAPKTNATAAAERADVRKATTKAKATKQDAPKANDAQPARPNSKRAEILDLIRRPEGASANEIMEATDWLLHSVRGFVSNMVRKGGQKIEAIKRESGERPYHPAAGK